MKQIISAVVTMNDYHDIWQKNAWNTQVKPNCLCSSINKIKNVITFQINTEMENNTQHHFLIRSRALSRLVWCFRIPDALTIFNQRQARTELAQPQKSVGNLQLQEYPSREVGLLLQCFLVFDYADNCRKQVLILPWLRETFIICEFQILNRNVCTIFAEPITTALGLRSSLFTFLKASCTKVNPKGQ